MREDHALLIIDIQNDFCLGGPLEVPGAEQIVEPVNRLMREYSCVVATQDWHPENHFSFLSEHPGEAPFTSIRWRDSEQVIWPDHCIAGSAGADFQADLDTEHIDLILRKGTNPNIDSYSAFYENDKVTITGLAGYFRERGITTIDICGLAADVCVFYTAVDARREGFSVNVLLNAVRGINNPVGTLRSRYDQMRELSINLIEKQG